MNRYTLAIGSNQGNAIQNLKQAVKELAAFSTVIEISPCFENPPMLPPGAPTEWFQYFANAAVTIETEQTPQELLARTQVIEQKLGRSAIREKWSPRPLDIDVIFCDPYQELNEVKLQIPHKDWKTRNFVLAPLLHLAPPKNLPGEIIPLARKTKNMPPALMAALNITPDSFSQTTKTIDHENLIQEFQKLLDLNIAIIDVGGESTRPGATPVAPDEEWNRIAPLLDYWKSKRDDYPFTRLSLDTYHPETAKRALDYKVNILNDVSHLTSPAMQELAPHFDATILMQSLTVPADKNKTWPDDADVIKELKNWFDKTMEALSHLPTHKIIFDPGLGFGKTPLQSLQILQRINELADLPVRRLVGHSRKSFMSSFSQTAAPDRDIETLGASLALANANVEILRVHNVEWHQRALRSFGAVMAAP